MVLEHWVNYYFPEVNDENDWLKLVSEWGKGTQINSIVICLTSVRKYHLPRM